MDTEQDQPLSAMSNIPDGLFFDLDGDSLNEKSSPEKSAPEENEFKYSEEDLHRVREQEKSKLYSRIEKMSGELQDLRNEREERLRTEQEKIEAASKADKQKREEEMGVRELLEQKEKEWQAQIESLRQEQERDRALLDQERAYNELMAYQASRVEEERENILPELLDLVTGNTPTEIDASLESLKERSNRIFDSAQQALGNARREVSGSRVTMPPTMDQPSENSGVTPEAIKSMSMQDYAKHRQRLLSQQAQGRSQGLFG